MEDQGWSRICIGVKALGTAVDFPLEWSLGVAWYGMHARVVLDMVDCHDCGLVGAEN